MMVNSIRNATPDDYEAVKTLCSEMLRYEHDECDPTVDADFMSREPCIDYLKNITKPEAGHLALVYEEEGMIKGYASLRDVPPIEYIHRTSGVRQIQLQSLSVHQKYRDQGIGRQLIEACRRIATENGYSHLKIVALSKNERARHLYKNAGFVETEIIHEMEL